jgi:hypothetical protein
MLKIKRIVFIVAIAAAAIPSLAEQMFALRIGPVWPRDIFIGSPAGKRTAWDAGVDVGMLFDKKVGVGVSGEFMWHTISQDSSYFNIPDSTTRDVKNSEQKRFMFPVSLFLMFDPISQYVVHPVIRGQIGFNMLTYTNKSFPAGVETDKVDHGFYMGIIGKVSAEAHYKLGDNVSLISGFEYQWSRVQRKVENTSNQYYRQKLYGPGIRVGILFVM